MKIICALSILFCLFGPAFTFAQGISGTIKDNTGNPVEFATVSLKKISDSIVVVAVLADENGKYEINKIKAGNYFLSVSMVGLKTCFSPEIIVTEENKNIQSDLVMEQDSKLLGEMQVVGKKPIFEQEAGKTTVNVENSAVSSGLMALELLKRTPGVMVDNEGNISLKGKQNVLLLIDGKPTYLSAKQAAAILKSLSSNQISTIEVMTTPPAKYDAQGNAGVININLKKGAMEGINGTVHASLGQGQLPKSNVGFSLTTGLSKWTLASVYDFTANKDFSEYNQNRNFGNESSGDKYIQKQRYNTPLWSHTFRVSADYKATKKLSVGTFLRGLVSNDIYYGNNTARVISSSGNILQRVQSKDKNPDTFLNFTGGLSGKYKIDSAGHELSADVDYSYFGQKSSQDIVNSIYLNNDDTPASAYNLKADLPVSVNILTYKADYVKPLSKIFKLEAGAKRVEIDIDSDVKYAFSQTGSVLFKFPSSNRFIYNEHITAAYASTNFEKGKWSGVVGLRAEWWHAEGKQVADNEKFYRDSILPFPNAILKYKAAEKHSFSIAYNRRIDRPNYQNLNPLSFYTDPYTVFSGNPRLRAQLTQNIEFSHTFMDGALVTTLNYGHTDNLISNYNLVPNTDTSSRIQAMTSINIPKFTNMGASVSIYLPVNDYWTFQAFVNAYQNRYSGSLFSENLSTRRLAWMLQSTQTFTLPYTWGIEASGTYISPGIEGYSVTRAMGLVSLGVQKQVFDLRGTVKLAIQDIFYTFIYRGETNYAGVNSTYSYQWDNRVVTLTFTWKFGNTRFSTVEDNSGKNKVSTGKM